MGRQNSTSPDARGGRSQVEPVETATRLGPAGGRRARAGPAGPGHPPAAARLHRRDAADDVVPRRQGHRHRPRGGHVAGDLLPVLRRRRGGHPRARPGDGARRRAPRALVAEGSWKGRAGYHTALDLTDAFFAFWDQHRPVLRVVDLSTDEGDRRFRNIRVRPAQRRHHRAGRGRPRLAGRGQEPGRRAMAQAGVARHHAGQRRRPPLRLRVLGHPHGRRAHLGGPPRLLGHDRPAPPTS